MQRNLFLALIAVILATVPLAIYSADTDGATPSRMKRHGFHGQQGHGPGNHAMGLMKMFRQADDLEITNPQLLQLRMLYQKNCNAGKDKGQRRDLFKKLSDPSLKEADIKKIAAEAGKAAEESIMAKYNMMQEIKKILTPEQLKKLTEMKKTRSGKRGQRRGHGKFSGKGRFFQGSFEAPTEVKDGATN